MSHNKLESARFAQASDKALDKFSEGVEKALSESAARGFPVPGGDTLTSILGGLDEARGSIAEANGKVYEERSEQLYKEEEFALTFLIKVSKFAMELYREQLFNAIAIEQAEQAAEIEAGKANISMLNLQTESRMAAIIRDKAEMEQRITSYKLRLVQAEEETIAAESTLEDAKMSTAEKKLEILDSIYQVLAAEKLVLVAEEARSASLIKVLAAQQVVAGIKKEMVPFHIQKAQARQALALATEREVPILKALEMLGYERIRLRTAEENEKHQERLLTLENEMTQEEYMRAHSAYEVAKRRLATLMLEYGNSIKAQVIDMREGLTEEEVRFRLFAGLSREQVAVSQEIGHHQKELKNLSTELVSVLKNLYTRGLNEAAKVKESATQFSKRNTTHLFSRHIREGVI